MKNDLEYFRKFSLIDYSVNIKKFRDYLEFCKKNELYEEKLFIIENLVNHTNEKSQSLQPNLMEILNDFTNLCVLTVIFSDFEIEFFFKIPNFSLNFQKTILIQSINYCIDRAKTFCEVIQAKFQFWVLKLINNNISSIGTGDSSTISQISNEEINQSIESLHKLLTLEQFSLASNSLKCFLLKTAYELGYYNYLNNKYEKMNFYFTYCVNNFDGLCNNNNKDNNPSMKSIYFNKENIIKIMQIAEKNSYLFFDRFEDEEDIDKKNLDMQYLNENSKQGDYFETLNERNIHAGDNKDMQVEKAILISGNNSKMKLNLEKESMVIESDFANLFHKISIKSQDKAIIDKYSIDDSITFELFDTEELLKYSKNLIFLAVKNYSRLKDAQSYLEKVKEILNSKLNNSLASNEKELKLAIKENSFHHNLIILIDSIYKGDQKLPKQFLSNLSSNILKLTLTDDLEISGMIHGLIINFHLSFNNIKNYFNDFVEFFGKTSNNTLETVNQIFFINSVLKIIHHILYTERAQSQGNPQGANDTKAGATHPDPSGNFNFCIQGELHYHLMNLIFFWLTTLKENKTNKCDNILFILIKTVKNTDFLLCLKIIFLIALKFVSEKKNLSNITNDELYEHIYMSNPNCFKIDTIINENKKHKKFSNLIIIIKEETNFPYSFDALNLNYFEEVLFNLILKIERKIIKNGVFSEIEYLERRNNLLFFHKSGIKDAENISNVISEFVKYYQAFYRSFKIKFYNADLIEDLTQVENFYKEFKSKINETILIRFIYLLSVMGKTIEAAVLLQYIKKIDYDLAYKLLKNNSEFHNVDKLEFIWKTSYLELLANIYHQKNKTVHLSEVTHLLHRTSSHQYFKKHLLRKLFKILNFFKFIENL